MFKKVILFIGLAAFFVVLGAGLRIESSYCNARAQLTASAVTDFAILYGTHDPRQVVHLPGGYIRAMNLYGNSMSNVVYDTLSDGTLEADSASFNRSRRWLFTVAGIDSIINTTFTCSLTIGPPGQTAAWDTTVYVDNGFAKMLFDFPMVGLNLIMADADEIAVNEQFIIGILYEQYQ